jgi:hypothetical protein
MGGRPFNSLSDLLNMIPWCNTHPAFVKDVYFCLSSQNQVGEVLHGRARAKRLKENASFIRAIWLDIDVKAAPKGYPDLAQAVAALRAFCTAKGYPFPNALVASGGGLHAYWIASERMTPDEWLPYAQALREAAVDFGLRCDAGLTTDEARVLRVPGTFNHKTTPAKPVTLLHLTPDYIFDGLLPKAVGAKRQVTAAVTGVVMLPGRPAAAFAGLVPEPFTGLREHSNLPLDPVPAIQNCPMLLEALRTGGKNQSQGLWNLTTLINTFVKGGRKLATLMSQGYKTYDPGELDALWDRKVGEGLGWPSCHAISNETSICKTCPHWGKIRSPLNLTSRIAPPAATAAASLFTVPGVTGPIAPADLELPSGYEVDNRPKKMTGHIGFIENKLIGNAGQTTPEWHELFLCKVYNQWVERDPAKIHFTATTSKGQTTDVTVLQEHFSTQQALELTLNKQGVKYVPEAAVKLKGFFMHWLAKMHAAAAARKSSSYGWHVGADGKDHGFAYGGSLFMDTGQVLPAGFGDAQTKRLYAPRGVIDPWFEAFRLITEQDRPHLEALVAVFFAAPLMRFTGQYNGTISGVGLSGVNKTSAVKVGLGIWADPKNAKENDMTSIKSLLMKAGSVRNIAVCWDDIPDEKMKNTLATTMTMSQGRGAATLKITREQNEIAEWQSLLCVAANKSFVDFAISEKHDTAMLMRMFEFKIEPPTKPRRLESYEADLIYQGTEENFGHMGLLYAQYIATHILQVQKMVTSMAHAIGKAVGNKEPERFWMAMVSAIWCGAAIYNDIITEKFAGQDKPLFALDPLLKCLIDTYKEMRQRIKDGNTSMATAAGAESALTLFLKAFGDRTAWTDKMVTGAGRPGVNSVTPVFVPPHGAYTKAIEVRWILNERLLRFSSATFNKHMKDNNINVGEAMAGLKKFYNATIPTSRFNLASGLGYSANKEQCIEIYVPQGSELEEGMYAHTPLDERPDIKMAPVEREGWLDPTAAASTGLAGGMAQAAKDLELVRGMTGP